MTDIIRHSDIDVSKINYQKPSRQGNVYYSSITYEDSKSLYIQTPKMKFHEITKDNHLSMKTSDQDFSMYDRLLSIDEHNLGKTYGQSKEWFQKTLPMDVIETMYRKMTHPFKKGDTPIISLKLPVVKQVIKCNIYDSSNQLSDRTMLEPDVDIICILHVKGLKFLKKDFYCDCYISQIKVCSKNYSIPGKCIIEEDEEEVYDIKHGYECLDEEVILQMEQLNKLRSDYEKKQKELNEIQEQMDRLK